MGREFFYLDGLGLRVKRLEIFLAVLTEEGWVLRNLKLNQL